jgi:hypothetical protein
MFTEQDIAANFVFPPLMPRTRPEYLDGEWKLSAIEAYDELSPNYARVILKFEDGRRQALRVGVSSVPPYAIRYLSRFYAPEGVITREASEADGEAIAELERRTPVVDAGVKRSYDRQDWFAQLRLMERPHVVVAEIDDRIAGVHVASHRTAIYEGRPHTMLYMCRTRVDPGAQGKHLFPAINGALVDTFMPFVADGWSFDSEENFIAVKNERIRELAQGQPDLDWRTLVRRLSLGTAALAAEGSARVAQPTDLDEIAAILEATHGGLAGHVPVDTGTLAARLGRAPASYGFADVLIGDGAVVGVWDEKLVMRYETEGEVREERSATVLDYGCHPGSEAALISVLRQQCARLAARGITKLSIYTSDHARLLETLTPLAATQENFSYRSRVAEPAAAIERGVYVDPIYF